MDFDLIYDVGSHDGLDTEHYLERGFRVVAIDANPEMSCAIQSKFRNQVASKRLTVVNCAIGRTLEKKTFWVSDHSDWSSFDEQNAKRLDTQARPISVECVPFKNILGQFGVPFYLKIDIEGSDELCIIALKEFQERPRFISWESADPGAVNQLRLVRDLGYTKFKIIRQTDFASVNEDIARRKLRGLAHRLGLRPRTFQIGSSGPFGESTRGRWRSWTDVAEQWRMLCQTWEPVTEQQLGVWYDFHAAR